MSEFKTSNKKCVIPNCYSRAKNAVSVQLFPFPTDRTMYKKWERQAKFYNLSTINKYVCTDYCTYMSNMCTYVLTYVPCLIRMLT